MWKMMIACMMFANLCAEPKEELSTTMQKVVVNGQEISYKATAGTLLMKNNEGEPKATIFYIAYTKEGGEKRPITFCFNGGPGSSSIWLHMGGLGPKRVKFDDEGKPLFPFQIEDNPYAWLDLTDLVFIDPVSTGYSRVTPGVDAKEFHGVDEDIRSVSEFIRLYVTRQNRWNSPKFLVGESYGTFRAAGVANYLHETHNLYMNGILLVSSFMNSHNYLFESGNDLLPYVFFLPTYTATAWHHQKLTPDLLQKSLGEVLKESEAFAMQEYTTALLKGDQLTKEERLAITAKLSRYTGLSSEYIDQSNLRIPMSRFTKELLRNERRTVGRFDSRFKGVDSDSAGECCEYDPSHEALSGAFTSMFNHYVRHELHFEKDEEYKVLSHLPNWNWKSGGRSLTGVSVTESLRETMSKNHNFKVFVASGYYDMATPYFASTYTFRHLGLDPALQSNIQQRYYPAGHMMYIQKNSHIQLKKDVTDFFQWASPSL